MRSRPYGAPPAGCAGPDAGRACYDQINTKGEPYMKKLVLTLTAALLAAALLAGCGGDSSAPASSSPAASAPAASAPAASQPAASAPQAEYNLADVVSAVEAVNPVANPREIDDFSLENTYMLTMDNVAGFCGKVSNDAANSALILAVQAVPGKVDDLKAELDAYKTTLADGGLYAEFADKEAQAKEARLVVKGDCVVLVIANTEGAQYADIDKALDEALS